jgi:peptide deformylase
MALLKIMKESKLNIRLYGDPCLRKKSEPIDEVGAGERILIKAMIETMYESKGVGLAAPQIGINKQLFVADIGEGPFAVINPKITRKSGSESLEEGCLCLPGLVVNVKRPKIIDVQYTDENNHPHQRQLTGMMARVFQHENDHLIGKLIIDYASWRERKKLKDQIVEIQKKEQGTTLCHPPLQNI